MTVTMGPKYGAVQGPVEAGENDQVHLSPKAPSRDSKETAKPVSAYVDRRVHFPKPLTPKSPLQP